MSPDPPSDPSATSMLSVMLEIRLLSGDALTALYVTDDVEFAGECLERIQRLICPIPEQATS